MDSTFKHVSVRLPRSIDRWLRVEAAKMDISKSDLIRAILGQAAGLQTADFF